MITDFRNNMIIGFDLDDVLLNFHDSLREYCNVQYNRNHARSEVKSYFIEDTFGLSREEGFKAVTDFYTHPAHREIPPMIGAIEGINTLKENHKLFIVTARPETTEENTLHLINKYFPNTFQEIHFTNHFYGSTIRRMKSELCKKLGIEIFIDDSLNNANDIAEFGIPVLLFDAPWNQGELKHPTTRVYSWPEIVKKLNK